MTFIKIIVTLRLLIAYQVINTSKKVVKSGNFSLFLPIINCYERIGRRI